ncbi:MAG: hypothetical protein ACOZQL_02745 [Myxococcota bacterium]
MRRSRPRGQRTDCRLEELACAAVCIDDGRGGCLCNAFRCVAAAPPSCETLSAAQCGARSDCHVESIACATASVSDQAHVPCTSQDRCVSGPPACASLNQTACQPHPHCRFTDSEPRGGLSAPP